MAGSRQKMIPLGTRFSHMTDRRTQTILAHADRRIPRYTSYPTAPHFSPSVSSATYRDWLGRLPAETRASVYLHVPFCRTLCWYCGCHTRATQSFTPVARYLDMIEREMALLADALPNRLPLAHVHWGGGSPSLVAPARFRTLMDRLDAYFDRADDAEVAVEVDPRTVDADFVDAMADCGVTRVSMGVQTFDPAIQQAINRVQTYETVAATADLLRCAGIAGLNMDLLYGLPHQSVESAADTARQLVGLAPDRVSVFGYAHVPHMMKHQRLIDESALPGPADRLAQADANAETLLAAGYVAIGLDHFARADDSLAVAQRAGRLQRNFQGYTVDPADALFGLGASSIGALPQGYVQNVADIRQWHAAVRDGHLPVARGVALTSDDRLRRDVIMRLMCDLAVDLDTVAASHGMAAPAFDLDDLEAEGVICRDGNRISLAAPYRTLARIVAAAFDARLAASSARHAIAV